jgi:hypothetical protein
MDPLHGLAGSDKRTKDGLTERDADSSACASPPGDLHCLQDIDADRFVVGPCACRGGEGII